MFHEFLIWDWSVFELYSLKDDGHISCSQGAAVYSFLYLIPKNLVIVKILKKIRCLVWLLKLKNVWLKWVILSISFPMFVVWSQTIEDAVAATRAWCSISICQNVFDSQTDFPCYCSGNYQDINEFQDNTTLFGTRKSWLSGSEIYLSSLGIVSIVCSWSILTAFILK